MRRIAILLALAALSGCAPAKAVMPGRIAGPSPWTMVPPVKPLPDPQDGEDGKELLKQCRAAYGHETDKIGPLQNYVRAVTKR